MKLDRDHRGQAFAHIFTGEVVVLLAEDPLAARVCVQGPGEGRTEPGHVGTALVGVDVVGEAEDRLLVGAVPLHRHFDGAFVFVAFEVHDLVVHRLFVLVEVADEVLDAAVVLEGDALAIGAFVVQVDLETTRQERCFPQPVDQRREVVVDLLEDLAVGEERNLGAVVLGRLTPGEVSLGAAPHVILIPEVSVGPDLQVEFFGERVDHGDADAVQATGHLGAAAVAELAAGVEHGQDDLGRGALLLFHDADRDATAVVGDADPVVRMDDHGDFVAMAGQCFVDGVVDDLVDEVMQPAGAGRADVHTGSLAHSLEAFQDSDVLGAV